MIITYVVDGLWCPGQSCSSASGFGLANRCDSNRCDSHIKMLRDGVTLVNVNAPVVATTSWWLHFTAPVVA